MRNRAALIVCLLLVAGTAAFAQSPATANMSVTANVIADCRIDNGGAMNFGNLGVAFALGTTNATANTNIQYTCTNSGVAPHIRLGQGSNPTGTSTNAAPQRRMINGSSYISYALYQDSGNTVVWGNDTTTDVDGVANGVQQTVTVYGVATHANVPAGAYTDTVVVAVDF